MKLVLAVIQNEDVDALSRAMEAESLSVTRIGSTGGFLRAHNVTLMMAVEASQVERVFALLSRHCRRRTRHARPDVSSVDARERLLGAVPIQVGGATVFILDVERMEKIG